MSTEPNSRDIDAATEQLADNPALIYECFERDSFWKDLVTNCYAQCEDLRESFEKVHAERIHTLALRLAAERAQEEADEAEDDARHDAAYRSAA